MELRQGFEASGFRRDRVLHFADLELENQALLGDCECFQEMFFFTTYLCHVVCPGLELGGFDPIIDPAKHFLVQILARVYTSQIPDKILAPHPLRRTSDRSEIQRKNVFMFM